jgi:hypothetical protein
MTGRDAGGTDWTRNKEAEVGLRGQKPKGQAQVPLILDKKAKVA